MINTVKIDVSGLTEDLIKVKEVLKLTDNMATSEVCHLYIELCEKIANGVQLDEFTMRVAELKNNIDCDTRHNINIANRPSLIQEKYGKEDDDNREQ